MSRKHERGAALAKAARRGAKVAVPTIAVVGIGGIAYAVGATNAPAPVIKACYDTGGADAGVMRYASKCRKGEKPLSWNQKGVPGAPGEPGAPGPSGANGTNGKDGSNGADGAPGQPGAPGADGRGAVPGPVCDELARDAANAATASVDLTLTINGIRGGSTSKAHPRAIEVDSFCFGGRGAADLGTFTVEKRPDVATGPLIRALADGAALDEASMSFTNVNGDFLALEFHGLHVAGLRLGAHGNPNHEEVSFAWTSVTETYRPANSSGVLGTPVTFTFTAPAERPAASEPSCVYVDGPTAPATTPAGTNLFLTVTGVGGESTSKSHKGAIEVRSFCFGGTPDGPGPLSIGKYVDSASPKLLTAMATGASLASVRLDVEQSSTATTYLSLILGDAKVTGYRQGGHDGSLTEDVVFEPTTFQHSFRAQSSTGVFASPVVTTW